MNGSEKQVAWANEIRAKQLRATKVASVMGAIMNNAAAGKITEEQIAAYMAKHGEMTDEVMQSAIDKVASNDSAAWWIDRRANVDFVSEVVAVLFA